MVDIKRARAVLFYAARFQEAFPKGFDWSVIFGDASDGEIEPRYLNQIVGEQFVDDTNTLCIRVVMGVEDAGDYCRLWVNELAFAGMWSQDFHEICAAASEFDQFIDQIKRQIHNESKRIFGIFAPFVPAK